MDVYIAVSRSTNRSMLHVLYGRVCVSFVSFLTNVQYWYVYRTTLVTLKRPKRRPGEQEMKIQNESLFLARNARKMQVKLKESLN